MIMQATHKHSHSVWFGDELKQQHSVGTYINCSSWLRMRSILLCKIEVLVSDDDSEMNDFTLILMTNYRNLLFLFRKSLITSSTIDMFQTLDYICG